jgi:hypothetical protein
MSLTGLLRRRQWRSPLHHQYTQSAQNRTSFAAPETTSRDALNTIVLQRKCTEINEADLDPAAYSGLVTGSSAVRTNNEINSCSEPSLRSRWALAPSIGEVPSSSERAACIAPNAEKFDNQKPRAASFLFVRRSTQSYDEFIAAVYYSPRLSMMLGMINTSDIFLDWRKRKCVYLVWSQVT